MDYSKSSCIWVFVAVILYLCGLCTLAQCSEDIICRSIEPEQSNSTCEEIDTDSTCTRTNIPQNEVLEKHLQECFPNHMSAPTLSQNGDDTDYGANIDSCLEYNDVHGKNEFRDSCASSTIANDSYYLPNSVTTTLSSIGVQNFNMSMSWTHRDAERATHLEGYEIRVIKRNKNDQTDVTNVACFCVRNASQRNFEIPIPLWYDPNDFTLDITVSTFPRRRQRLNVNVDTNLTTTDWPANCLSIKHTDQDCGVPKLEQPTNFQAKWSQEFTSDESDVNQYTKKLDLSWEPPPVMDTISYRIPPVYYLTVFTRDFVVYKLYQVNNTQNVSIYGLNSSLDYDVFIQAYEPCSGFVPTAEFSISTSPCGRQLHRPVSHAMPPTATTTHMHTTTMDTHTTTMVTIEEMTTQPPVESTNGKPLHARVISTTVGVITAVILIVALAAIGVAKYIRNRSIPKPSVSKLHNGFNSRSCYVVVVFPLDTPLDREQFIRGRLIELQFYENYNIKVEFIKDFNSGIVAVTWEKQLQNATSILLICTPEFCQEWANTRTDRSPTAILFKLLKADLTTTTNDSNKYAAVVFNKRDRLPNNNFLSAIPRINMENESDIDNLLRHVTNTSLFVHTQTLPHHQNNVPHHMLASSPIQPPSAKTYNEMHQTDSSHGKMEDYKYVVEPCSTSHTLTKEHLEITFEHADCESSDLTMTPTSDGLSTSTSECEY